MSFVNRPAEDPPEDPWADWADAIPDDEDAPPSGPYVANDSGPAEAGAAKQPRVPLTVSDVLADWRESGPLVHEPTGLTELDELTGGGPVYGTRWYLGGAPDAGKTALLLQIAHIYAARGVAVGLLAVDEEAGDIVTRLAQRVGYTRSHCEVRDPLVLTQMGGTLESLPLRLYDGSWTIEEAAADLASAATARAAADPANHPHGPRAMLGVDSLQTVRCLAESLGQREMSEVAAVTARVHAIRAMATRHRLIAMATSELGRGSYSSSDPAKQTSALASGKWSGAIEYSARVYLALRSVAGEQDLLELELAKNKHGKHDKIHVRIDRRSQTLTPAEYDAPPPPSAADRDAVAKDRAIIDAAAIALVLLAQPGMGLRELRGAARAANGMGHDRVDAALSVLGVALIKGSGARGATPMSIDRERLSASVLSAMDGNS